MALPRGKIGARALCVQNWTFSLLASYSTEVFFDLPSLGPRPSPQGPGTLAPTRARDPGSRDFFGGKPRAFDLLHIVSLRSARCSELEKMLHFVTFPVDLNHLFQPKLCGRGRVPRSTYLNRCWSWAQRGPKTCDGLRACDQRPGLRGLRTKRYILPEAPVALGFIRAGAGTKFRGN